MKKNELDPIVEVKDAEKKAALSDTDKKFSKFADEFEDKYIRQSVDEDRQLEKDTLDLAWRLLSILPVSELKRVKEEQINKYLKN